MFSVFDITKTENISYGYAAHSTIFSWLALLEYFEAYCNFIHEKTISFYTEENEQTSK